MNLKENIISLYLLRILNQVIPLLSLPYIVRVLGADPLGSLVFVTAIMGYLLLVADYGFSLTATRDISKLVGNETAISKIYSAVLSAKILILSLQFFILCIVLWVFELDNPLLYIYSFYFMFTQALFPTFFFQGMGGMKWVAIINVCSKLSAVIVIVVIVNSPKDILLIPLTNSIFGLLALMASFIVIKQKYYIRYVAPSLSDLIIQFKSGWSVFSSNIYGGLYAGSGVVILGLVSNNTVVAYYSLAEKLLQVMKGVYLPLIQALFPWFSRFISSSERVIEIKLLKNLSLCMIALLVFTIFAFLSMEQLVVFLFGEGFEPVGSIFMILLLIPMVDFLRNISGVLMLINLGEEKLNKVVTQIGALAGIGTIYILSLQFGGEGAALGLVLTEIFVAFLLTFFVVKIVRIEK